jgi:hypothetical protein
MSKDMKKQSGGRAPVTQKNTISEFEFGSKAKSMLDVPADCAAELAAAGLEARWIDAVQLKKNHGYHRREWTPYKFKCLTGANATNPFGASEGQYDGYLLRQQLVLAAKPIEKANARRKYNQMRTKLQANPGKTTAEEFKRFIKENDPGAKVLGWDEKDESAIGSDDE